MITIINYLYKRIIYTHTHTHILYYIFLRETAYRNRETRVVQFTHFGFLTLYKPCKQKEITSSKSMFPTLFVIPKHKFKLKFVFCIDPKFVSSILNAHPNCKLKERSYKNTYIIVVKIYT